MSNRPKDKAPARDVYAEVTDRIVAALEQGVAPWVPSHDLSRVPGLFSLPHNGATGRQYSGINVVLLWLTANERGYTSPEWYTFVQTCAAVGLRRDERGRWIPEEGKGVRRGERGTLVTFWRTIDIEEKETGDTKRVPVVRHYYVWNRAQIDGLPANAEQTPRTEWERIEAATDIVQRSGARVTEGSRIPCYDEVADEIGMPPTAAYPTAEGYYVDLLHELTHWAGHGSRLARLAARDRRSDEYAREELVAEMGSAFLCASLGIVAKLRHAEYLAGWLRLLRADKRAIVHAASQARQAVEFLTGGRGTDDPSESGIGPEPSSDDRMGEGFALSPEGSCRSPAPGRVSAEVVS